LDHARTHHTGNHPPSHSSSSDSSQKYGLNWPAKHWSSSAANDEVIDLT
jgi:hypothetical protein